jgi:preprotein translocase subunit YajC
MELKTAIKMRRLFFINYFFTFYFSQTKNIIPRRKQTKKHPKIVRYISLNKGKKIIHDSNTITFLYWLSI